MNIHFLFITCLISFPFNGKGQLKPAPIHFSDISINGELRTRALQNFDRLETDIYQPSKVFPGDKSYVTADWPGDYEGRILLGLFFDAAATHRQPKYFEEMLNRLPERLNSGGYYGPLQTETIDEQQLSGNSWILRILCEYYQWKKDAATKAMIKKIIHNLALPLRGYYRDYPIDPVSRNKTIGGVVGSPQVTVGKWKLSTDVATAFVFLDGIVQAYEVVPSAELRNLVEEIIARFLMINIEQVGPQVHATLTALRGVLRYYTLVKRPDLLNEVIKRYELYRRTAMSASFENFNWFGRPTWTEPCAIVDAFMLSVQLWQETGKAFYINEAHQIYYNGLGSTQRSNGGFGLNSCVIPGSNSLKVIENEAWWCCTMRGAEGLARAVQYNYFTKGNDIIIPFFNSSLATLCLNGDSIIIRQKSEYPFKGLVSFEVESHMTQHPVTIKLVAPPWTTGHQLRLNGKKLSYQKVTGFIVFKTSLKKWDKIVLRFEEKTEAAGMTNHKYAKPGVETFNYGPLLLGYDTRRHPDISFSSAPVIRKISKNDWIVVGKNIFLSPVYHLLNPEVNKDSGYSKQILFKVQPGFAHE